jgi:hypothetical protein
MSPLEILASLATVGGMIYVVWGLGGGLFRWLRAIVRQLDAIEGQLGDINQTLKLVTHRGDLERIEREIAGWERRREEEH